MISRVCGLVWRDQDALLGPEGGSIWVHTCLETQAAREVKDSLYHRKCFFLTPQPDGEMKR